MPSTTHFLLIPPGGSNAQSNFNAARRLKADLPKGVSGLHGAVFLRDAAIGGPSTRGASSRSSAISLMLRSQESLGLLGAKDQFVYFTKSRPPDERFHRFPHTHTLRSLELLPRLCSDKSTFGHQISGSDRCFHRSPTAPSGLRSRNCF